MGDQGLPYRKLDLRPENCIDSLCRSTELGGNGTESLDGECRCLPGMCICSQRGSSVEPKMNEAVTGSCLCLPGWCLCKPKESGGTRKEQAFCTYCCTGLFPMSQCVCPKKKGGVGGIGGGKALNHNRTGQVKTKPDKCELEIPDTLAKFCATLLLKFDITSKEPGEFLEAEMDSIVKSCGDSENDLFTLVDLFFGILDRKPCIKELVKRFRKAHPKDKLVCKKEDAYDFEVIVYVVFFTAYCFTEKSLKNLFRDFSWAGAEKFYKYVMANPALDSVMMKGVLNFYSEEHVVNSILPNILSAIEAMERALYELNTKPQRTAARLRPRNTVVEPFKFHVPVSRMPVLVPMNLKTMEPVHFRPRPVPKTTYLRPVNSEQLENDYEAHREHARVNILLMLLLERQCRIYKEEDKSWRFYQKKSDIRDEREKAIQDSKFNVPRIPLEKTFQEPKIQPGTTYTQLLRQKRLCEAERKKEEKALEDVAKGKPEFVTHPEEFARKEKEEQAQRDAFERMMKRRYALLQFQRALAARYYLYRSKQAMVNDVNLELRKLFEEKKELDKKEKLKAQRVKAELQKVYESRKEKTTKQAEKEKNLKDRKKKAEAEIKRKLIDEQIAARVAHFRQRAANVLKMRAARVKLCGEPPLTHIRPCFSETKIWGQFRRREAQEEHNQLKDKVYAVNQQRAERREKIRIEVEMCRQQKLQKLQQEKEEKEDQQPQFDYGSDNSALSYEMTNLTINSSAEDEKSELDE